MKDKRLEKAKRLLKKKKYDKVISLLEKEILHYRKNLMENSDYYYILGLACMYSLDFSGADTYMLRCIQLDPSRIEPKLAMAAIYLRRHQTPEAIKLWLEVLEKDPGNRIANRALRYMKKYSDAKNLTAFLQTWRYTSLFPGTDIGKQIVLQSSLVLVIIVFLLSVLFVYRYRIDQNRIERPDIAKIELPHDENLTALKGDFPYMMTSEEIEVLFQEAKELLHEYRDNEARKNLNTIKHSNASYSVKTQASLLADVLVEPGFDNLQRNFSYEEVKEDIRLYENCFVIWKGRISNLQYTSREIRFDFLVGYENRKVLKGIVPVIFDFAVDLDPEKAIEVLAQIKIIDNKLLLEAKSYHQLDIP